MELANVFNFSDKLPGFSEIIELCLNLGIEFCLTWLVLPNYKKNDSIRANFNLTTRVTLTRCSCSFAVDFQHVLLNREMTQFIQLFQAALYITINQRYKGRWKVSKYVSMAFSIPYLKTKEKRKGHRKKSTIH